jgi:hypothetical protein
MRIFRFENKSGLSTIGFMHAKAPLDSDTPPCWQTLAEPVATQRPHE